MLGDFNAITSEDEKVGGGPNLNANSHNFRHFLFDAQLLDLGFKGPAYTWTNCQDTSNAIYERLDRVVANIQWTQMHPEAYVNHLPRVHSDHMPILLRTKRNFPNPRRFRVEHWWFMADDFKQAWEEVWDPRNTFTWQERLDQMTTKIRQWERERQSPQNRIKRAQESLYNLQCMHPNAQDHRLEEALLMEIDEAEAELEVYWKQRSRVQWTCEGDRNTSYFHVVATNRRRRNQISRICDDDGNILTEDKEIRRIFVSFYKSLYCAQHPNLEHDPTAFFNQFAQTNFQKIPDQAHDSLQAVPTEKEIKEVLFQMSPDKSPGPDGITARFLQKLWEDVKGPTVHELQLAFLKKRPPEAWLKSHIVLIPKVEEPTLPKDYRPITVGNILYRLLMKILANRVQHHMGSLISNSQTAFLKGRCISDNTVLVREILHSFGLRSYKEKAFLLKADVNKAFDTVHWPFIWGALRAFNFPNQIIELVQNCMAMSRVTLLLNGSGDGFITPTRGLR